MPNNEQTQVFLYSCKGHLPFFFASHHWFVVNKRGSVSRWEILFEKGRNKTSWGHLHMNFLLPSQGIEIIPFYHKLFWKGRLLGHIEDEIAEQTAEFIEQSPTTYPYCDTYSLSGPNSNTYAQWVLNKFPEFNVKLPWNAFGKNYYTNK